MLTSRLTAAVLCFAVLGGVAGQGATSDVQSVWLPGESVSMPAVKSRVLPSYPVEWFFEPGKMDGRPVATIVTVMLEFRLH
jgi:hypothetical protein